MSIQLKEDESVLAQCMVQGLTPLLTTNQLIVITSNNEESYPVQDILAIEVYNDDERYNEQVRKRNKWKIAPQILIGLLCSFAPGLVLAFATKEPAAIFGISIFGISMAIMVMGLGVPSPFKSSEVIKESLLTIILRTGESKQYRFTNIDSNERYVKTFAEKVFQVVAKKTSMTSFLN